MRVMVDLETLSTKPDAVILSIGAVNVDNLTQSFYQVVDPRTCAEVGCRMDVDTVMWWMQQSNEAREAVVQEGDELEHVLTRFAEWIDSLGGITEIWSNGADFDIPILINLFGACGIEVPWKFYQHRCFRTAKENFNWVGKPKFEGDKHNALSDAIHQAKWLLDIEKCSMDITDFIEWCGARGIILTDSNQSYATMDELQTLMQEYRV